MTVHLVNTEAACVHTVNAEPLTWGCRMALVGLYRRQRHNPFLARRMAALVRRGLVEAGPRLTAAGRVVARELARGA